MKVLIQFAHPAFQKSRVNKQLITTIKDQKNITINDLYENYPDFHINVKREQELLLSHDVIVYQYPFYWFSCPALLKEWMDLVLQHGFAYGDGGNKLKNKYCLHAVSTGGRKEAYHREGFNEYSVPELLLPFSQGARLCGMKYLPPFVIYGTYRLTDKTIIPHAHEYLKTLTALSSDSFSLDHLNLAESINTQLDTFVQEQA
jgi:glutathione-regulated potassium-efflux system ancillary protein KefG